MEKIAKYLIISIGMGVGAYVPALFGSNGLSGWSIIGTFFGGIAAVIFIYKLDS